MYHAHACIQRNRGVIFFKTSYTFMKKILTTTFIILSIMLILDSMNFGHALMMFYLAGIIPGTTTSIDADSMLEFFVLISGFTFARIMTYLIRSSKSPLTSTSQVQA
jgi:hypothetical protein